MFLLLGLTLLYLFATIILASAVSLTKTFWLVVLRLEPVT